MEKDINLAEQIFYLLYDGIDEEFDKFQYTVEIFDGYTDEELLIEKGGRAKSGVKTTFNGALLYDLVKKMKSQSLERGDDWVSFTMSYEVGSEVKVHFNYGK